MKAFCVLLLLAVCTVGRSEDMDLETLKAKVEEQERRLDALAACLPEKKGIERYFLRPNIITQAYEKLRRERPTGGNAVCSSPVE